MGRDPLKRPLTPLELAIFMNSIEHWLIKENTRTDDAPDPREVNDLLGSPR